MHRTLNEDSFLDSRGDLVCPEPKQPKVIGESGDYIGINARSEQSEAAVNTIVASVTMLLLLSSARIILKTLPPTWTRMIRFKHTVRTLAHASINHTDKKCWRIVLLACPSLARRLEVPRQATLKTKQHVSSSTSQILLLTPIGRKEFEGVAQQDLEDNSGRGLLYAQCYDSTEYARCRFKSLKEIQYERYNPAIPSHHAFFSLTLSLLLHYQDQE